MNEEKFCKGCNLIKKAEHYYKSGKLLQTPCKSCHNKNRRKRTPTGIDKLDASVRELVLSLVAEGKGLKQVSDLTGVGYTTLYSWRKKGRV